MKMKKKYEVVGLTLGVCKELELSDNSSTNSPETAITAWMKGSAKEPTMFSIDATSEDAEKLLCWAKKNQEKIREIAKKEKLDQRYDIDYLVRSLERTKSPNWKGVDQIYPFCLG